MGTDANLYKYKTSNISKSDRERFVKWREQTYYKLNSDDKKWNEFEENIFYTSDKMLNEIIADSVRESTGECYCEDGASLFNLDSLNLIIDKLNFAISKLKYGEYTILSTIGYKETLKILQNLLSKESKDLINDEFVYIYHATY
ncbi:hypothetical protein ACSW8S_17240 (plasmid) [Clostridium perfringens]